MTTTQTIDTKATIIQPPAKQEAASNAVAVRSYDPQMLSLDDNYLNPARFDQIFRIANSFAASDLVPDHFRGKPANCFIAIQLALRARIDPMVALQNLFLVHGKPGMESKLAIALANTSGKLKGHISYTETGSGESLSITAHATTIEDMKISATVSMAMAKQAGWTRNQAYATMPNLMLRYRAAMFLIRTHFPEVLFGMQTKEELDDVAAAKMKNVTPVALPDTTPVPTPSLPEENATASKSEALAGKLKRKVRSEDRQPGDEDVMPKIEPVSDDLPF